MNMAEQLDNRIGDAKERLPISPAIAFWRSVCGWWPRIRRVTRRRPKQLRLCESLPLGERRFVAVVEFERSRFLIGGTQESLVLLAPLKDGQSQGVGETDDADSACAVQLVSKVTPALEVQR